MDISMVLPLPGPFSPCKLLVNYRGYGLSTGSPTEQDIMGDSLAILDSVLKETGRTPDDVILVGQSLGSGVATQVASVRHVKKLVLLVPFDSLLETARGLFPYLARQASPSGPLPVGPGRAQSRLPCQHSGRGSG